MWNVLFDIVSIWKWNIWGFSSYYGENEKNSRGSKKEEWGNYRIIIIIY